MKVIFRVSLVLLGFAFLLDSCGEYPFDDYPDTALEGFTKIGSVSIGSEGGVIDFDSIQIDIPVGAFDSKNKIKVYVQDIDDEMAEYSLSSTFLIQGLPDLVSQPLEVRIRFEGEIDGDTLVAMGEMGYASSLNEKEVFAFEGLGASVDGSYIVCEIGGSEEYMKSGGKVVEKILSNKVKLFLLKKYVKLESSKGNFVLMMPRKVLTRGIQLAEYFEIAYDTCSAMGYDLDARPWPATVFFFKLKDNTVCAYYSSYYSEPTSDQGLRDLFYKGRFTVNTSLVDDQEELRVTAGHEFLHLVQNLYEFSSPAVEPNQIWLKEASAVWIESKFSTQNNYFSSSIYGNENEPFNTWDMPSDTHGYGMSVLIKDIADCYGDKAILKIHEAIRDGDVPDDPTNSIDALFAQLEEPEQSFYHSLMGSYLLGYYYDKKAIKEVWKNKNMMNEWVIKNDIDTLYTKTDSLGDLSTMLTYCTLDYQNIKKDASMHISVDDVNCGLFVGKYKAETGLILLDEVFPGNGGTLTLQDIKAIQEDGFDLIIMLTNSRFTGEGGKHQITFTAELSTGTAQGGIPVLVMPQDFTIGYYQYKYFIGQGYSDTLFFYKLLDPDAEAQAFERFPDGSWMQSFILGGSLFDSLYFHGGQLSGYQNVLPGTDILLIAKAENEFGVYIDTCIVHIGNPFQGISVLDTTASLWYPLFSSIGNCYPSEKISSLSASNSGIIGSYANAEYYTWRDIRSQGDTIAVNSVNTNFGLSISGSTPSGTGRIDYHRTEYDNRGDPKLDIQLNTEMTFSGELDMGMMYKQQGPSSFTISALNSSSTSTQTRVWHYRDMPDSTHVDNMQITGPVSFIFYGYLDIAYPCWK